MEFIKDGLDPFWERALAVVANAQKYPATRPVALKWLRLAQKRVTGTAKFTMLFLALEATRDIKNGNASFNPR